MMRALMVADPVNLGSERSRSSSSARAFCDGPNERGTVVRSRITDLYVSFHIANRDEVARAGVTNI